MGELVESYNEDVFELAEKLLNGGEFVPSNFKDNPGALAAAIRTGRELGLSPMVSMRSLYVVQGKVGIYYDASVGLLRQRGYKVHWEKTDASEARVVLTHQDGSSIDLRYTEKDARTAGLWGKGTWIKHPATMLRARALMNAARAFAGEIFAGLYCEDEIQEIAREEKVIEVQPNPTSGNGTLLSALNAQSEVVSDEPTESPEIQEDVASETPNDEPMTKLAIFDTVSEAFIDLNAMLNEAKSIKDLLGCAAKVSKSKTLSEEEKETLREKYANKKADIEAKDDE